MRLNLVGKLLTAVALAFAALQPAQAAIVRHTFSGAITSAVADNDFGLQIGDLLTGSVTFDTSLLTGEGDEELSREIDPSLTFTVQLGSFSFDETDSVVFPKLPSVQFIDGQISDVDFATDIDDQLRFFLGGGGRFGIVFDDASGEPIVVGDFTFAEAAEPVAAVPEPGTLALFSFGLAGIRLLRRRRA